MKTINFEGTTNIAATGIATQTNTYFGAATDGRPEHAIDGSKKSNWDLNADNSISLTTATGANAWWRLTFSTVYFIDSIVLWNRMDKLSTRIDDYAVKVGEALIGRVVYQEGQQSYHFDELRALGKQITIQGSAAKNKPVQLAEVEVFGGEITLTAEGKEVLAETSSETILCVATGISRTMKISWSGWESSNDADNDGFNIVNGEYDEENEEQVGKLIIQKTKITDDKTYTCTLSSEKHQLSDSVSIEVPLLVYKMECNDKIVYSGWNTILSCAISGLSQTAIVEWRSGTEVSKIGDRVNDLETGLKTSTFTSGNTGKLK